MSVFNKGFITWIHFFLLSSANCPKAGVLEGPGVGPGTPLGLESSWLECVSESESAVSDGEEYREVVRMVHRRRGVRRGVVRCSERELWDEMVAENRLGEAMQQKGAEWWEEVLADGGLVSGSWAANMGRLWREEAMTMASGFVLG